MSSSSLIIKLLPETAKYTPAHMSQDGRKMLPERLIIHGAELRYCGDKGLYDGPPRSFTVYGTLAVHISRISRSENRYIHIKQYSCCGYASYIYDKGGNVVEDKHGNPIMTRAFRDTIREFESIGHEYQFSLFKIPNSATDVPWWLLEHRKKEVSS